MLLPWIITAPISGTTPISVTRSAGTSSTTTAATAYTNSVDCGSAGATKELFLCFAHGLASGSTLPTVTFDGNSPDGSDTLNPAGTVMLGIYRYAVPAGGTVNFSVTPSTNFRSLAWDAYVVENRSVSPDVVSDSDPSFGSLSFDGNVLAGDYIITVAMMANNGTTGAFSPTGLTSVALYEDLNVNKTQQFFFDSVGSDATPRTMTLPTTGDGAGYTDGIRMRLR